MLLPAELDYKALTVSPVDAQLIDMLKLNRSMIAGIFNVPAHMINDRKKRLFPIFPNNPFSLSGIRSCLGW